MATAARSTMHLQVGFEGLDPATPLSQINLWRSRMSENLRNQLPHLSHKVQGAAEDATRALMSGDAETASMFLIKLFLRSFSEGMVHSFHHMSQRLLRQEVAEIDKVIRATPQMSPETAKKIQEHLQKDERFNAEQKHRPEAAKQQGQAKAPEAFSGPKKTVPKKTPTPAPKPIRMPTPGPPTPKLG